MKKGDKLRKFFWFLMYLCSKRELTKRLSLGSPSSRQDQNAG